MLSPFTRHTIRFKLFITLSLLTLLLCVTLSSLYAWREIISHRQRTGIKAQILASSLADAVRLPLFANDRPNLVRLAGETNNYSGVAGVTITRVTGEIAARSGSPIGNESSGVIFSEAPVQTLSQGENRDLSMEYSYGGDSPLGKVRVTMDNSEMSDFVRALIITTSMTALFFWITASYLSYLAVQWITRSLFPLITGLTQIRGGEYATRIPSAGNDELTVAATAINELAESLQKREAENERLQQELVETMRGEVKEERRKVMAKLIQTNRMTSLGLLVAGMAHEINTPNAAIRLAGQQSSRVWRDLLPILNRVAEEEGSFYLGGLEYPRAREELIRSAEMIVRSAEKIDQVVKNLRSYNLGERQSLDDRVNVTQVIMEALAIIRAQGGVKQITLVHDLDRSLPPLLGNRYQLEQVVTNLLLNGMQAIPEGRQGTVTVSTGQDDTSSDVFISIRDDGGGIPADVMPHLLEPFFSTRIEKGGSGLGLYISNFIVTEHRGRLTFTSEPGLGTTVTVSIPSC